MSFINKWGGGGRDPNKHWVVGKKLKKLPSARGGGRLVGTQEYSGLFQLKTSCYEKCATQKKTQPEKEKSRSE